MDFLEDLLEMAGRKHRKYRKNDDAQYGSGYPANNNLDYCPRCSAPIVQGAKYCQRCGASLSSTRRKAKQGVIAKLVITGLLVVAIIFIVIIIFAAIYAVKNHTQIFEGFSKVVQYIFGDSLNNVIRNLINQGLDNFFRNLFNGTD